MTILFDMDGTLIDSSTLLSNSINYVRFILRLKPLEKDYIIKEINNPYQNLAKNFYDSNKITQNMHNAFREYYTSNHKKELKLFNGMDIFLETLQNKGFKLGVATNAYRKTTKQTLEFTKLSKYFSSIVTAQDVKNPKPKADMLIKSMQNLKSKKTVFIGDSQNDKLAAKAAKLPFLYVDFINNTKAISSVEDLAKEIEAIF